MVDELILRQQDQQQIYRSLQVHQIAPADVIRIIFSLCRCWFDVF